MNQFTYGFSPIEAIYQILLDHRGESSLDFGGEMHDDVDGFVFTEKQYELMRYLSEEYTIEQKYNFLLKSDYGKIVINKCLERDRERKSANKDLDLMDSIIKNILQKLKIGDIEAQK